MRVYTSNHGDSVGIEFSEFPHIIITGVPNAMQDRIVCALASSFSAARLRLVLADFGSADCAITTA